MGQKRKISRWVVTKKEGHNGMGTKVKDILMTQDSQEDKESRLDPIRLDKELLKRNINETSEGIGTYQKQHCNSIQETKIKNMKDIK